MCFLIKETVVITKNVYLYDRILVSNRNFTTEHLKIVKNSRFLK